MKTKNELAASSGRMTRLVSLLLGRRESKWEATAKGPATIHGWRYEIKPVEIQGTYVKEVDQSGKERYWVTEPDGTTYLRDASKISEANAERTHGEDNA